MFLFFGQRLPDVKSGQPCPHRSISCSWHTPYSTLKEPDARKAKKSLSPVSLNLSDASLTAPGLSQGFSLACPVSFQVYHSFQAVVNSVACRAANPLGPPGKTRQRLKGAVSYTLESTHVKPEE